MNTPMKFIRGSPKLPRQQFKQQFDSNKEETSEQLTQKRLVEQFYMPKLEAALGTQSYSDLVSTLRNGKQRNGTKGQSPGKELVKGVHGEFFGGTDEIQHEGLSEAAREGHLDYMPIDGDITWSDGAVEQMLEVDREEGQLQTLNNMMVAVQAAADSLERDVTGGDSQATPRQQVAELAGYLAEVAQEVEAIRDELKEATGRLRSEYKNDMQVSVNKLDKVGETLDTLGERLQACKTRMQSNKELMGKEMAERIEILEYILRRFSQYDHKNRQRRVTQMISGMVVLVLVGLILSFIWREK